MAVNVTKTWEIAWGEIDQSPLSNDVSSLIASQAQRIGLISSLALGALAQQANAEEVQLAVNTHTDDWTVSSYLDTGSSLSVEQRLEISNVVSARQKGMEYYAPYIEEFQALPAQDQLEIALSIYPENGSWWLSLWEGTLELVRNLRIPEDMIWDIVSETKDNGANPIQRRGYKKALVEFRETWVLGTETMGYIIEKAPQTATGIYVVVAYNWDQATVENNQATVENNQATASAAETEERLRLQEKATEAMRKWAEAVDSISD